MAVLLNNQTLPASLADGQLSGAFGALATIHDLLTQLAIASRLPQPRQSLDAKAEKLALLRYGLIGPSVLESLPRGELTRRAEEIAARHYDIPDSQRRSVSVDTLLEWSLRYRVGGFEALAPKPRQDRGQSRAITHNSTV